MEKRSKDRSQLWTWVFIILVYPILNILHRRAINTGELEEDYPLMIALFIVTEITFCRITYHLLEVYWDKTHQLKPIELLFVIPAAVGCLLLFDHFGNTGLLIILIPVLTAIYMVVDKIVRFLWEKIKDREFKF